MKPDLSQIDQPPHLDNAPPRRLAASAHEPRPQSTQDPVYPPREGAVPARRSTTKAGLGEEGGSLGRIGASLQRRWREALWRAPAAKPDASPALFLRPGGATVAGAMARTGGSGFVHKIPEG